MPSGGPEQHHLSLTNEVDSVVVVSFVSATNWTGSSGGGALCTFGAGPAGGTLDQRSVGDQNYTYHADDWEGTLWRTQLRGLTPSTVYTYNCGGPTSFTFTSPKSRGALPVTVGIVADLGAYSNRDDHGDGNQTIEALIDAAKQGSLDAIVHAGDIAYTSGNQPVWDRYFREVEAAAAIVPYQVAPGNHESYANFSGYRHRFAMASLNNSEIAVDEGITGSGPNGMGVNNLVHAFTVGAVGFVALSTEKYADFTPGSTTHALVEDALAGFAVARVAANDVTVQWIVVFTHHPLYCSTNDENDCERVCAESTRPNLHSLLAKYGVDMYVAGHLHNYERSYPIGDMNGTLTAHGKSYVWDGTTGVKGVMHIVAGQAGDDEGLTDDWVDQPEWSAFRNATLGWNRFTALNATHALFEYVSSLDGSIVDSAMLVKPAGK